MEIGLLGMEQSGKSTLFQILTGVDSSSFFGERFVRGIAKVPDERFDNLVQIFKPAKVTPATTPFIDVNAKGENAWDSIRQSLSSVDGILHIVGAFSKPDFDEIKSEFSKLEDELILSDLIVIEKKIERLEKMQTKLLKVEDEILLKILPKAKELLEQGKPLRGLTPNDAERAALKNFSFWSIRPKLIVLNTSEEEPGLEKEFIEKMGITDPVISICCQIEKEISQLQKDEQTEFLKSMNIETPAFERIIQTAFSLMQRISYFTVGEDEVKAWVIPANSTAPKAASAIHKDFERGFIKAEVVSYSDFIATGSDLAKAKSAGKLRLEGKEYIVQDGDIISFRFNV